MKDTLNFDAINIDISGGRPVVSLISLWFAKLLKDSGKDFWVMPRGMGATSGMNLRFTPRPNEVTRAVLFIGNPHEAIEYAARVRDYGLHIELLIAGVEPTSPPVTEQMLSGIDTIYAPPEAKAWLKHYGVTNFVSDITLIEPFSPKPRAMPKELCISVFGPMFANSTPFFTSSENELQEEEALTTFEESLPFPCRVSQFKWNTDDYTPISLEQLVNLALESDVCITKSNFFDDPIRTVFESFGVQCISPTPADTLPQRIITAALQHRDGTFTSSSIPLPEAPNPDNRPFKLGVVIPFGGLPLSEIKLCLSHNCRVTPPNIPIVFSELAIGEDNTDIQEFIFSLGRDGITVTRSTTDYFRLGLARNLGAALLPPDVTHVAFIDADIFPDPRFFQFLEQEANKKPDCTLVPHVQNSNGGTRLGTGVSIYPLSHFKRVGGFSKEFKGWGYEDLDLLDRLRVSGVPATIIGSAIDPMLHHTDHPPRLKEMADNNYKRWQDNRWQSSTHNKK